MAAATVDDDDIRTAEPNASSSSEPAKRATTENETGHGVEEEQAAEKSAPGGLFAKLGLDVPTFVTMFKGSLPPVISVAIYQSTAVSSIFGTLGYEIPIISVLAMCILPRGKYLQTLALNLVAVSVGSAVALLVLWSGVQARQHTTPPTPPGSTAATRGRPPYNSSQSAVCAVWLFANIWFVNLLRSKLPSFNLPSIVYSILVNIAATFGPSMTTTAQAEAFGRQLLTAQLLAFAIATAVSLLVFPVSSRRIVAAQFTGAIGLLRKSIVLQREYLRGLEKEDMFTLEPVETSVGRDVSAAHERRKSRRKNKNKGEEAGEGAAAASTLTKEAKAALALREAISQLRTLVGKLQGEITFAKRDTAWGKLDGKDLSELFKLIRKIFIPVVGLSTIMDIFRRVAEHRGWVDGDEAVEEMVEIKEAERHVWNVLMQQLHEPFTILSEAIDQGLEHAGIQLELLPRPKEKADSVTNPDVEAQGDQAKPGDVGFAKIVDDKVKKFTSTKSEILRVWARERGLAEEAEAASARPADESPEAKEREHAQLYVLLYMEQLMHATGEAVQDLVDFADKKVADGTMKKSRLIVPPLHRLRKWAVSVFKDQDSSASESPDVLERGVGVVFIGDGFSQKRDPEHLPPASVWQKFGNGIRVVSKFLSSPESMFGLRCACATMTVGIVGFLQDTQGFFQEQRLVWAMIIIAIGMTQTSGQSIFGFFCRVGGSLIAMICAYLIWYIVDQRTAGAIVFLWLSIFVDFYFLIKFPRFTPAVVITIITQVLIIAYELQVRQIGIAASEATGQPFYPTYELAPYRVATVAGGCLVAFFWTVFPSPLTDRTWIRRDLSATLYLLANYFSVINETMKAALKQKLGNMDVAGTPAHRLLKVRQKLFSKLMLLLPSLQAHADWQKWEPTIGGRFPREAYEEIVLRANRILNYLSLISYTVTWQPRDEPSKADTQWLQALSELITNIGPTHYTILSTLTLLSNSLLSGQSLPPYIPLPQPYELTRQLLGVRNNPHDDNNNSNEWRETTARTVNTATGQTSTTRIPPTGSSTLRNILDAANMDQQGYTEFAVLQVCSTLVCDDLEGLIQAVSGLVGVVDFSFRVDVSELSSDSSQTGEGDKGKGKRD